MVQCPPILWRFYIHPLRPPSLSRLNSYHHHCRCIVSKLPVHWKSSSTNLNRFAGAREHLFLQWWHCPFPSPDYLFSGLGNEGYIYGGKAGHMSISLGADRITLLLWVCVGYRTIPPPEYKTRYPCKCITTCLSGPSAAYLLVLYLFVFRRRDHALSHIRMFSICICRDRGIRFPFVYLCPRLVYKPIPRWEEAMIWRWQWNWESQRYTFPKGCILQKSVFEKGSQQYHPPHPRKWWKGVKLPVVTLNDDEEKDVDKVLGTDDDKFGARGCLCWIEEEMIDGSASCLCSCCCSINNMGIGEGWNM